MSEVGVHRLSAEDAGELVEELGEVHREVFAEPPYECSRTASTSSGSAPGLHWWSLGIQQERWPGSASASA